MKYIMDATALSFVKDGRWTKKTGSHEVGIRNLFVKVSEGCSWEGGMSLNEESIMDTNRPENTESTSKIQALSHKSGDRLFYFVLKKAERLTAAIYMTSGILSDNEPLKWHVRQESLRFLESVRALHSESHTGHFDALAHCARLAESVVSVLEIARLSRLISEMNFTLLKQEYVNLIELLRNDPRANGLAQDVPLGDDFLKVEEQVPPQRESFIPKANIIPDGKKEAVAQRQGEEFSMGHIKDSINVFNNVSYKNPTSGAVTPVPKEKGKRRSTIIKLLQKKADLTIKDISQAIPGCSEKTVQRELIALIKDNLVVRTGERRWSRYSMKA